MARVLDEKMENQERTPLLTTVHVAPRRQRYPHNIARRFCTVCLGSSLVFLVVLFLLPVTLLPRHRHHAHPPHLPQNEGLKYKELQRILLDTPDASRAKEWSRYYTSGPHLAGKNFSQALWTQEKWVEFGIQADIISYDTLLNYPLGHRLALYENNGKPGKGDMWNIKFEASLEEDVLSEDPTTGLQDRIPTFHGYSASGNVTAPFVYVNYGTYQDFQDLVDANIRLEGSIAVAKYGGIFRGLKIKRAEELGMVGVILYTDPGDDGLTDEKAYPQGPGRNPSSVQRGSAQFLSVAPGDPTTPGYPSKPGAPRKDTKGVTPTIPSIPISYLDAIPILKALNGYGPKPKDFNKWWDRNLGLKDRGVDYNIGPSPSNLTLNLVNEQQYSITPIWNVIGVINGTLSDEVIVIGNHRDAWIAGGAGDPNSGSAALLEVIRSFGIALEKGWKPLRTIVFASWDGEEYGLIGSTEWVEEYLPWLSEANVAYVNVDVGAVGPRFHASASPLLNKVLHDTLPLVKSPNQTVHGQTVYDLWDKRITTMGSGSDFTAFQDYAGIPSIDLNFGADATSPANTGGAIYHYHSNYDSFHWMEKYGDPGFHYHIAIAKVWALFTAALAESPVIPLNATDYALALDDYVSNLESKLDATMAGIVSEEEEVEMRTRPSPSHKSKGSLKDVKASFKKLHSAAISLKEASQAHDGWGAELAEKAGQDIPWWKWISKLKLYYDIRRVNSKYKLLERQFLHDEGLDSRSWFKHVVFAPGLWTGYSGAVFPGLVEALDARNYELADKWVSIIEEKLYKARESLK